MGASASRAAKTAAGAASHRQYPTRIPTNTPSTNAHIAHKNATSDPLPSPGPSVHPAPHASGTKDDTISLDARDPDFAASLQSLGPVQTNSTRSNTSTFRPDSDRSSIPGRNISNDPTAPSGPNIFPDPSRNPALRVLQARTRLAEEAEEEFTRSRTGRAQRRFLDVTTIRQAINMRDQQRLEPSVIEDKLGLAKGVVSMLSAVGDVRVGKRDKDDAGIYD